MTELRLLVLKMLAPLAVAMAVAPALPAREAPSFSLTAWHVPR
jgi:hypothetical protein